MSSCAPAETDSTILGGVIEVLPSVEDDAMEKRSAVGLNSIMRIMGVWEQKTVWQAFYAGKTVELT